MRKMLLVMLVSVTAYAQAPDWTRDSERHVYGGDIVHWGTGEAPTPEVALFKARHMAIKALVEECGGVANKDIIPRKQYVETILGGYRAFATASLVFESCDYAKTKQGSEALVNPKIAEGQKLYDELLHGVKTEAKADVNIEDRIRDYMKAGQSSREQEIGELRNEIEKMKIMIHQPIVQEQVVLPATDSMKKVCWTEYTQMQDSLTLAAADHHGNMADPSTVGQLNQLERKKNLCQRLK